MITNDNFYPHLFNSLPSMTYRRLRKISTRFPDLKEGWERCEIAKLIEAGLNQEVAEVIYQEKKSINQNAEYEMLKRKNINILLINDKNYPTLLKEIFDPPCLLYYQGEWPDKQEQYLAAVGTRRISPYGRQIASDFTTTLARNGLTIVSGLALGVDTCAHKAALAAKKRTIAVLGSGLNFIYPIENRNLAEEIKENGLVISELPPNREPEPYFFPLRNRIISGLSLGVLVVEAKEKSGALVTAEIAIEQNREVFAIPGSLLNQNSRGPNKLIQNCQAYPVLAPQDILEKLKIIPVSEEKIVKNFDSAEEKMIYNLLLTPTHIDEIGKKSGLGSGNVNALISLMEIKELIYELGSKMYGRR